MRPARLVARWSIAAVFLLSAGTALHAQAARPPVAAPQPARSDSMLAQGRLAAAEDALYAAADARPRDPGARGALAAYLASRGRFAIALVLFDEAQRFGADASRVQLARQEILPYAVAPGSGSEVTVPLVLPTPPRTLAAFTVRPGRSAASAFTAALDPNVRGVVLGRRAAAAFALDAARRIESLWIGERRLTRVEARVDSVASPDDVRIGLDVLWGLHPLVDESARTITLGRAPAPAAQSVKQIPFVLTFPGLMLVPEVGVPPVRAESPAGRALLGGRRWQLDARAGTVRVEQ
jgi:hypothetical protein